MPNSLVKQYNQFVKQGEIVDDAQQRVVVALLEEVRKGLLAAHRKRTGPLGWLRRQAVCVKGLYVWGGVGIGKTFLMDMFFDALPFDDKVRLHFHAFMRKTQQALRKHQGEKDPLMVIAKQWRAQTSVLCFDEFFVEDVADAMLLGTLFKYLFAYGVTLVASSNSAPDDLYRHGVQRDRFLPAIECIKTHTTVYHLAGDQDYRQRAFEQSGVYYTPLDTVAVQQMQTAFANFSGDAPVSQEPIRVNDRLIPVVRAARDCLWVEFDALCRDKRSQLDYLDLAEQYETICLSEVPIIAENEYDVIYRFILMVDVFYDKHVRLIVSAAAHIENLYTGERYAFEYQRTQSRLIEMQSEAYWRT